MIQSNLSVLDSSRTQRTSGTLPATVVQQASLPKETSPPTPDEESPQQGVIDHAELTQALKSLTEYVQNSRRDLSFSVDEESGRVVVKVMDSETKEVIRQMPSEEVMALVHALKEPSGGLLHEQA